MYRALSILVLFGGCLSASVPHAEVREESQPSKVPSPQGSQVVSGQLQPYTTLPANQLSFPQYYPTYPEYASNGYVQPSYEGYLIPADLSQKGHDWSSDFAASLFPFSSKLLAYGTHAGTFLLHLLLVIILGGAFTTMVCTFTPICSISFLGVRNQVHEQVADLARTYITPESVNAATLLVTKAVDKYAAMQREKREKTREENENPSEPLYSR
ncbi:hypothetical protein KM043_004288 [Ampulex compressa]|nr:hypothetical protein KM043_004288 [Ampulex compressa]